MYFSFQEKPIYVYILFLVIVVGAVDLLIHAFFLENKGKFINNHYVDKLFIMLG